MSWTKKNVHPGKIVSTSQEVEVQVLEVDPVKHAMEKAQSAIFGLVQEGTKQVATSTK